ncbi:MAG: hypothetical protein GF398_03750 [Chitinivibrionales bacterium]|nr:hypothetical protein [Chitinivibrionales bacterium]
MKQKAILFSSAALVAVAAILAISCSEDEDAPNCPVCPADSQDISIAKPGSSTIWRNATFGDTVRWSNAEGDSVQLRLYEGSRLQKLFPSSTPNTGQYLHTNLISKGYNDSNYSIQIIDEKGNVGWSASFTIASDPLNTYDVMLPELHPDSALVHGAGQTKVQWSVSKADSVELLLYKDNSSIGKYAALRPNTGIYEGGGTVEYSWRQGNGYRIKVVDKSGHFGWSPVFEIERALGEAISVAAPDAGTVWNHNTSGIKVDWTRSFGSDAALVLMQDNVLIDSLASDISNDGLFEEDMVIKSAWGTGKNFQVKVEDDKGNFGYSAKFQIKADPREIINVIEPGYATAWRHGQERFAVAWDSIRGVSLVAELYLQDSLLDTFCVTGSALDTFCIRDTALQVAWGNGDGYQIKVRDDNGNFGLSRTFRIESGGTINVTSPDSGMSWYHGDSTRTITWEESFGDSALVLIYRADILMDTLCNWDISQGFCPAGDSIPSSYGKGVDYRIKVLDNTGNFGWGGPLRIAADTQAVITVRQPDSTTIWFHHQTKRVITATGHEDSLVQAELWRSGAFLVNLIPRDTLAPTDSVLYFNNPVQTTWTPGDTYQIRVVDGIGNRGWSRRFAIKSDSLEQYSVTTPDADDVWYHGQTDIALAFNGPENMNLSALLYYANTLVDTFTDSIVSVASALRAAAIPSNWGAGDAFTVKVIDSLGRFGVSDTFEIRADSLNVIDIVEPDAASVWNTFDTTISVTFIGNVGDSAKVELYRQNVYLGLFCDWQKIDSVLACTRTDSIPSSWGTGDEFKVKLIDNAGYFGWSERFSLLK